MSECLRCEGYIEKLHEMIYELECKVNSLENENEQLREVVYNETDWSVEL